MSVGGGHQYSSIKPNLSQRSTKKELKFSYSTAEYDSYSEHGFTPPNQHYRRDKFEVDFLTAVDPGKGPVKIRVTKIFRIKATDFSTKKQDKRDFIYWDSEWNAQNWLGLDLWLREHVEGRHYEQTKQIVLGDFDPKTGHQDANYVPGTPRLIYTIPFSKTAVDKILKDEHPFGPDSINITEPEKVVFYGKFDGMLGFPSFRCAGYTYDQFITPEFSQFLEVGTRPGGPLGKKFAPEKAANEYYR